MNSLVPVGLIKVLHTALANWTMPIKRTSLRVLSWISTKSSSQLPSAPMTYTSGSKVCTPPCISVEQFVLSSAHTTYRESDSVDGTQRCRLCLELSGCRRMCGSLELHYRSPTPLKFWRSALFSLVNISSNHTQKTRALARRLQGESILQLLSIFSALAICPPLSSAIYKISRAQSKLSRGAKQSRKRYVNTYNAR